MSLQDKALLVTFSASVWSNRKSDKAKTAEVQSYYGASRGACNLTKIFINKELAQRPQKIVTQARTYLYSVTSPWMTEGGRILNSQLYFEFLHKMNEYKAEFEREVNEVLRSYENEVLNAEKLLGSLFKRTEYPALWALREKYAFEVVFLPVPENDWRVSLSDDEKDTLKNEYEQKILDTEKEITADCFRRIHTAVERVIDRLDGDKIFRDSLINNVQDLVKLLPVLNITNDVELNNMRIELENKLTCYSPDTLRENTAIRDKAKKDSEGILNKIKELGF